MTNLSDKERRKNYIFYRIWPCFAGYSHASAARGTLYESITAERETSFPPKKYSFSFSAYCDF